MSENYFAMYLTRFGGYINDYSQSFIDEVNAFINERIETNGICFCNEISDKFSCLKGYQQPYDYEFGFCTLDPDWKWDWDKWKEDLKNTELFKEERK